jgi:hypothetical protein
MCFLFRNSVAVYGLVAIVFSLTSIRCWADEGMFPVSELDHLELAKHGLQMDVNDIFNADGTCLVDGICRVNGCTGSFVSPQGLIITNHHCAYRAIQSSSTADRDYLKDGFRANTMADEIPAIGYVVRITESFKDVSEQVLEVVTPEMGFVDRTKAIERRGKELEKQAEAENPGMRAEVAEMFTGRTYVLFLYTFIKDVRLVFAPPASVGNFGGDVDNWEWPRHTGDFSFMRAYVSPDGKSADYAADNVPYQPKRFIQVAAEGVNEGDYVMLLGYPGRTARHNTASFLKYEQNVRLPFVVDLYGWQIAEMEAAGKDNREVALKLLSRIQGLANTEKRSRGQLKGLRRAKLVDARTLEEEKLQAYFASDPERDSKYGQLLREINSVYREMTLAADYELNLQAFRTASAMMSIAFTIYDAAVERRKDDLDRETPYMDRNWDRTRQTLMLAQRDLHVPTDKIIFRGMLERLSKVNRAKRLKPLAAELESGETMNGFVESLYQNTRLGDSAYVESLLEMPLEQLHQETDAFIRLMMQLYPDYLVLRQLDKEREGQLSQLYGDLIIGKQSFLQTNFIPDANGTLRLTFGHIKGYSPEDAVIKTPITTLAGVVAKTTGEEPFVTPQKILDMYEAKDFGKFALKTLNDIPVAILYDTDTTGGNSGSPILNAKGELVGVNFDRAFEATINDFAWNMDYSRSLGVDIRYALWITGKVYGSTQLLEEMGIPGVN